MDKSPKYASREQQELFEKYLLGRMTMNEKESFENLLELDPELNTHFSEFKTLVHGVEEAGLRKKMGDFHENLITHNTGNDSEKSVINFNFKYLIAASVTILFALGGFWYLNKQSTNEELFHTYYYPDPGLPTVMGKSKNYDFYEAMVDYKHGDYDMAIEKWKKQLFQNPQSDTLNYFLASAQMAKGNEKEAIEGFSKTVKAEKSIFFNEANLYLGLANLKEGNLAEAKKYLKASNMEAAKEISAQLPK